MEGRGKVQLSHTRPVASVTFGEPNLVSAAGLVPLMGLARKAGLRHGAMGKVFGSAYAPSTLGSFLRTFTHPRAALDGGPAAARPKRWWRRRGLAAVTLRRRHAPPRGGA